MSNTNKLIVRVTVEPDAGNPVVQGMEVEYIGTVDARRLALDTLGSCIKDAGINKTIQGQQVVNVIEIPMPDKPSAKIKTKKAKKK